MATSPENQLCLRLSEKGTISWDLLVVLIFWSAACGSNRFDTFSPPPFPNKAYWFCCHRSFKFEKKLALPHPPSSKKFITPTIISKKVSKIQNHNCLSIVFGNNLWKRLWSTLFVHWISWREEHITTLYGLHDLQTALSNAVGLSVWETFLMFSYAVTTSYLVDWLIPTHFLGWSEWAYVWFYQRGFSSEILCSISEWVVCHVV
jgi:hypothetical protein